MSVSKDLRLIAKIADTGELRPVQDAGITANKFVDHDARMIFQYIEGYYKDKKTKGNVPTRDLIEHRFPKTDLPNKDRLNLESVIEEFLIHGVRGELAELAEYIVDYGDEPDKVLNHTEKKIREISAVRRSSQDIEVGSAASNIITRYEEAATGVSLKGIPYPWDLLNEETGGMLDGEYIIFYGRPKSLKTWVALNACVHAYTQANARVLIYTREMSPEQMMNRCACLLIGAPWNDYKNANLHQVQKKDGKGHPIPGRTLEDELYDLPRDMLDDENGLIGRHGQHKSLIITSDREDRKHGGGVGGLRRKVEDYKPDLIFVDAVYLMRNDREGGNRSIKWTDQTAISQDLKDLAQDFKRPLIATLQANRDSENNKGKSTANMAYADAFGQDCDLAMELIKKRIDKETNEIVLSVTASREMNLAGFAINGNPGGNFSHLIRQEKEKFGYPIDQYRRVVFNDHDEIKDFFKIDKKEIENGVNGQRVNAAMKGFSGARHGAQ
jgi:replicative DNA helicase